MCAKPVIPTENHSPIQERAIQSELQSPPAYTKTTMATKKGFPQAGIGRKIQKINDQEVSKDVTKINFVNNRDNFVAGKTRENFNK